jgi:AraC-like DNA-binding protein
MREKFQNEMLIKPSEVIVPSNQKVFIEKLTGIIEQHIESENFSVEILCKEIGMSRAQLHRKIKAISNQSATEFIRTFRLRRAADLIKQDAGNMAEIAYKVGFNSQAYFTKSFQEVYGCTPGEFKKQQALLHN